ALIHRPPGAAGWIVANLLVIATGLLCLRYAPSWSAWATAATFVPLIAAMKAGAKLALAADIDHLAESAARLNATLNDVRIETTHDDLLSSPITWPTTWDVILIGDLVYEPDLKQRVGTFLEAARAKGAKVIYADRTTARRPAVDLRLLAEYEAPLTPPLVEDFIERARVWELGRH
ncbi:MAG: hypothetical protein HOO99_03150, partial [Hyphomicrobiaceae bacterium]|nr:hypothetical protein [Hyphomicrobiaceae bacterium]